MAVSNTKTEIMQKIRSLFQKIQENFLGPSSQRKMKYWMFGFLFLAFLMWVSIIFLGKDKYADETDHIRQIHRFTKGDYSVMSGITTIPGYHIVIATIASFFPPKLSPQAIRFISFVFSLVSIGAFFLLAKKLKTGNPHTKTLQYVFLPISFIYFPLLYTDIFSLLLILTAFYFLISKKYSASALFSLIALTVRQNNIIWVAFFWLYGYILENGFLFSWKRLAYYLRAGASYIIVGIFFLLFVWLNHGVAFGDKESHQVGFYMGNIYFFLVTLGVLFLPVTAVSLNKMSRTFFKERALFGIIAGLVLALLFFSFPPQLHEYNLPLELLRNLILLSAYGTYAWAYALAIFFGCLTLSLMTLEKKSFILIPFMIACLAPSFLIEQRYMIVPLVFLLLLRKEMSPKVEYVNMMYFFLLSSGLVYMLLKVGIFF